MRKIQCYECGKRYDFDVDDFCPKCGSFTQPPRQSRISMDGAVVRVDGINERNHRNSFVHAELHGENRQRKGSSLVHTKPAKAQRGRRLKASGSSVRGDIALDALGEALDFVVDLFNP